MRAMHMQSKTKHEAVCLKPPVVCMRLLGNPWCQGPGRRREGNTQATKTKFWWWCWAQESPAVDGL